MLSPDKILLMRGRVRSLDLLPRSASSPRVLSTARRLRAGASVSGEHMLESLSDGSSENSDPFESAGDSEFGGISSGLSCFFSLEKMDIFPFSVILKFKDVWIILLPRRVKLKLNQWLACSKSIENILVIILVGRPGKGWRKENESNSEKKVAEYRE